MKKLCSLLFLLLPLAALSQKQQLAEAEKLFESRKYGSAKALYLQNVNLLEAVHMAHLAHSYLYEVPGQVNFKDATVWYTKAAEKGHAESMYILSSIHGDGGAGFTKDTVVGFQWLKKAAAAGNVNAITQLGALYYTGRWTEKDQAEGLRWLEKGAEAGNERAILLLTNYSYQRKDYSKALKWSLESDNADANNLLGNMYEKGLGVKADPEKALGYYYRALYRHTREKERKVILGNLARMAYETRPGADMKQGIDRILGGMANGFADLRGNEKEEVPLFLPEGIVSGKYGLNQDDAVGGKLSYFGLWRSGFFRFPYVRVRSSYGSNESRDKFTYLFSGLLAHSIESEEKIESLFNEWSQQLKEQYPRFTFREAESLVFDDKLVRKYSGKGTYNGMPIFIDLNMRPKDGGLYYLELVVKDRAYLRIEDL